MNVERPTFNAQLRRVGPATACNPESAQNLRRGVSLRGVKVLSRRGGPLPIPDLLPLRERAERGAGRRSRRQVNKDKEKG